MNWEIYPEGLKKVIENEVNRYNLEIPIHITENGMANNDLNIKGKIDDQKRIDYYLLHLQEIQALLDRGYNIKSYFAWSLLDNYEWSFGYSKRFGLVYVDFESQKIECGQFPQCSFLVLEHARFVVFLAIFFDHLCYLLTADTAWMRPVV